MMLDIEIWKLGCLCWFRSRLLVTASALLLFDVPIQTLGFASDDRASAPLGLASGNSSDPKLSDAARGLAAIRKEFAAVCERQRVDRDTQAGATERQLAAASDRYSREFGKVATEALELARKYPESPEAPRALMLIVFDMQASVWKELRPLANDAYELLATRYANSDEMLPQVRLAWNDACVTTQPERFLRTVLERSSNPKVKAQACFSLGRHQAELLDAIADLDHPVRGPMMLKAIGAENVARLRAMDPNRLRADAAAVFQRTMREFGDARPFETLATLGEQAAGALLRLNALEVGRPFPELGGIDLNGRPVKISDFRGKVVAISFWASWCGPCMGMVPDEKALVERMKGRPFVLVGVNGDNSVEDAKATAVKTGMNWRSLHGGGIGDGGIAVNLGISAWPTIFLLDGEGIIRDVSIALRGRELDGAVEGLVLEVEKGVKGR